MNEKVFEIFGNIPYMITVIFSIPIILYSLSIHEYSHALTSYSLGDPTAKLCGRLTINPLKHIDPAGFICMLLLHVGWAKPVPIDTRYYKKPRLGTILVSAAGPLSNILLSFITVPIFILVGKLTLLLPINAFTAKMFAMILYLLTLVHILNLGLGLFNLIPIPPLDGSRILGMLLPTKIYAKILQYEHYISFILLIVMYVGGFSKYISVATGAVSSLFFRVFSFMS